MAQCVTCHTENPAGSLRCHHCETPLPDDALRDSPLPGPAPAPPPAPDPAPPVRPRSPFSSSVPRPLRRSESRIRWTGAIVGLVLGVGSSLLLYTGGTSNNMLQYMFDLRRIDSVIPVAISWLFFWALTICLLRRSRLRALEKVSRRVVLLEATRLLRLGGVAGVADQLTGDAVQASPMLRRIQAVVQQWRTRPGLPEVDIVLQQHVAHDQESVHAAYSLVRTFVWALPVLGLIGTVLGISTAVGGFAQFLGGSIEDVSVIKKNLVGVTGGLSFAFLITLQGLLTSLVIMLVASGLQTREENVYAATQQGIVDVFLPALQSVAPALDPNATRPGPESWTETLTESLLRAMRQLAEILSERLAAEQTALFTTATVAVQAQWRAAWESAAAGVTERLAAAGATIANGLEATMQTLQAQLLGLRGAAGELRGALVAQDESTAKRHGEVVALLGQETATLRQAAETLAALPSATGEAVQPLVALREAVEALQGAKLDASLEGIGQALSKQIAEVHQLHGALREGTSTMHRLVEAQTTLQSAMRQLDGSGLVQSLNGLREALDALAPVLDGFRKPFVLQAVPVLAPTDGR